MFVLAGRLCCQSPIDTPVSVRHLFAVLVVFTAVGVAGGALPMGFDTPAGETTGTHGWSDGSFAETTLVEVQTVTGEETDPGELRVELGYQVGDAISEFEIELVDARATAVHLDGFDETGANTYTWDEQTEEPSIRLAVDGNQTRPNVDGYEFVDTGEWTLAGPVDTTATIRAVEAGIERKVFVRTDDRGIAGQELLYLGEYESAHFEGKGEQFQVVRLDDTDPETPVAEIGTTLRDASALLDSGGETDEVTVFVVTDPLRQGGLARGADFWVHEDTLFEPRPTLYHEYVHTRQESQPAESTVWTQEAEAEYYSFLLALKQGDVEYHDFHDFFADAQTNHADVVLVDPDTWDGGHPENGARADYELGGLVLAALDAEIRAASDGTHSYEDVFRAKNTHDEAVTEADLESFVASAAGTDLSEFFERSVRSPPESLSVPSPTVYDAPIDRTSLSVSASNLTVDPGQQNTLVFEITNTGERVSLAPSVEVGLPTALDSGDVTVDGFRGVDSRLTAVDTGWVLDHLDPGETLVLEYELGAPDESQQSYAVDVTVTDLAGTQGTGDAVVEVAETPDAVLDAPAGVPAGDSVVFDASASSDADGIETYSWEILGPLGETGETATREDRVVVETTEPALEHVFDDVGEYRVAVTVESGAGVTATASETVVASDRPDLSLDAPEAVAVGEAFFLNATVENRYGDYEVHWQVAEQEAVGERLELTLADAGEREVLVTVEDEYGATVTETVVVTATGEHGETTDHTDDESETTADIPATGDDSFGPGLGVVTALVAMAALVGVRYWKSL